VTNPHAIAPLDPPATDAELAWWLSRQRRTLLWGYAASVAFWGLFEIFTVGRTTWSDVFVHPFATLGAIALEGGFVTFFYRLVFGKVYKAVERTLMAKAIRDRRVRHALLEPPSE
jgi:hypothetical protein